MPKLRDKVPDYLLEKVTLFSTVTFAALFSVFFFLVVVPYTGGLWSQLDPVPFFNLSLLFYCLGLLIIIVSKRVMYACRSWVGRHLGRYLLWNFVEVLLVALCFIVLSLVQERKGTIQIPMPLTVLLIRTTGFCLLSLGIPYLVAGMFFAIRDKDQIIRMTNYGNVVSDEDIPSGEEQKITLFDNSGVMRLSVRATSLYYIESDDNYIKVWYTDSKDVLKQYMLRCRLKTVEESFRDSDLVRCHRKYIINMSKVRVLSREKAGYFLELDTDLIDPIPVTKTYEEAVLDRFNARKSALR